MEKEGGEGEKKAGGKEAQGAVKCRTRKKARGKDRRRGRVAFVFRVRRSSLGRSVGWWPEPSGKEKLREDGKGSRLRDVCRKIRYMNCIGRNQLPDAYKERMGKMSRVVRSSLMLGPEGDWMADSGVPSLCPSSPF